MPAVSDYIKELQSYEEYAFSWEELLQKTNASKSTIRQELTRLIKKNDILNLRRGFYLILPPRYRSFGKLPVELYIDKLFKYLDKSYYIAFYSAASFHGAAHQQIQQDYIVTPPPVLRDILKDNVGIRFFKATNWPEKNIIQKKSDAGYFNVSSPALTFADLIYYQARLGGINRMLSIIEELTEEIEIADVIDLLKWYPHKSVLQRMGLILEEILPALPTGQASETLTKTLYEYLKKVNFYPVLMNPKKGENPGRTGNKWRVDVNILLESDL